MEMGWNREDIHRAILRFLTRHTSSLCDLVNLISAPVRISRHLSYRRPNVRSISFSGVVVRRADLSLVSQTEVDLLLIQRADPYLM